MWYESCLHLIQKTNVFFQPNSVEISKAKELSSNIM